MPDFGVKTDKQTMLAEKMLLMGIEESDIEERFVLSGGPGGQNRDKTSTCVYLKHVPTGIEVKYQKERSQALNRYYARKVLTQKIETYFLEKESEEQQRIEKIKRQKRKRSKRAKQKILEDKRKHSQKKERRSPVPEENSQ